MNCCPSNLFFGSTLPPPFPFPKITTPPQTKPRRGGGLRHIKSVYRSIFLDEDIFIWCPYS